MRRLRKSVLIPILFTLALAVSRGATGGQSVDQLIAQKLSEGGIAVTDVIVAPGRLTVTYDEIPGPSVERSMMTWLHIMETAATEAPTTQTVAIHVDSIGEPLLEVVARTGDVRALLGGEVDETAFFDGLVFSDRRAPERALRDNMSLLGILYPEIKLEGTELHITFLQPGLESADEAIAVWGQLLVWVADKTGGLTRTTLHAVFPDGSTVDVSADMPEVLAYRSGDLSLAELLIALEFSGLPEVALP